MILTERKVTRVQTRDRVEKSTLAAKRLNFFAGDTQNINESKINLDS